MQSKSDKKYYETHKKERNANCKTYYQKNKEKWKVYNERWRKDNKDKIKERNERYVSTEEGRQKKRETQRRYRINNYDKTRAREIAHEALSRKIIRKVEICEECGKKTKTEMHHEDYCYPLYIHWLCFKCHRMR